MVYISTFGSTLAFLLLNSMVEGTDWRRCD